MYSDTRRSYLLKGCKSWRFFGVSLSIGDLLPDLDRVALEALRLFSILLGPATRSLRALRRLRATWPHARAHCVEVALGHLSGRVPQLHENTTLHLACEWISCLSVFFKSVSYFNFVVFKFATLSLIVSGWSLSGLFASSSAPASSRCPVSWTLCPPHGPRGCCECGLV